MNHTVSPSVTAEQAPSTRGASVHAIQPGMWPTWMRWSVLLIWIGLSAIVVLPAGWRLQQTHWPVRVNWPNHPPLPRQPIPLVWQNQRIGFLVHSDAVHPPGVIAWIRTEYRSRLPVNSVIYVDFTTQPPRAEWVALDLTSRAIRPHGTVPARSAQIRAWEQTWLESLRYWLDWISQRLRRFQEWSRSPLFWLETMLIRSTLMDMLQIRARTNGCPSLLERQYAYSLFRTLQALDFHIRRIRNGDREHGFMDIAVRFRQLWHEPC